MPTVGPSAEELMNELRLEEFLPGDGTRLRAEREAIENAAKTTLETMAESPTNYRQHFSLVQEFLTALWKKYDCDDLMDIVRAYTKVEPILLDLERDETSGRRYRDHSVHSFNVFVFGLRLIAKLIDKVGDDDAAQAVLKVKPERIKEKIRKFRDWPYRERLFYLWTLMSTFHDLAIPLERLGSVRKGLGDFAGKFGLRIAGPSLQRNALYAGLDNYFCRLGSLFKGEVSLDEEGLQYDESRDDPYLERFLGRKFEENDHGVLSGILIYRKIEEMFLMRRGKAQVTIDSSATFDNYAKYVLRQDIARASLAMSLHNLECDSTGVPLFLPLSFNKHPLAYILILSDGLQEYLRWEGTSIVGATKFCCFPTIDLNFDDGHFELKVEFFLKGDPQEDEYLKDQARSIAVSTGREMPDGLTLNTAGSFLLDSLLQQLDRKIDRNREFRLKLSISRPDGVLVRTE